MSRTNNRINAALVKAQRHVVGAQCSLSALEVERYSESGFMETVMQDLALKIGRPIVDRYVSAMEHNKRTNTYEIGARVYVMNQYELMGLICEAAGEMPPEAFEKMLEEKRKEGA